MQLLGNQTPDMKGHKSARNVNSGALSVFPAQSAAAVESRVDSSFVCKPQLNLLQHPSALRNVTCALCLLTEKIFDPWLIE